MPVTTNRIITDVIESAFDPSEVANILYDALRVTDRLPGSPAISVVYRGDIDKFVLTQTHRRYRPETP